MDFHPDDLPSNETKVESRGFYIHFLAKKQVLERRAYQNADEFKQAAFALYGKENINENNAILIYLDPRTKTKVLLTHLPRSSEGEGDEHFTIHTIHPACAMCSNSFGILDDQQVLQCSIPECGEQYCAKCVRSIQGSSGQLPFICVCCRKENNPQRNLFVEKHLIWPRMAHAYGTENLPELKQQLGGFSTISILQDIELRRIHLQARLDSLQNKIRADSSTTLVDEVKTLCRHCEVLASELKTINSAIEKRGTLVHQVLEQYQKDLKHFDTLCESLLADAEQLQTNDHDPRLGRSTFARERHADAYAMQQLANLPSDQSKLAIEKILEDVDFRRTTLSSRAEALATRLEGSTKHLDKARDKLKKMDKYATELNNLRGNLRSIERCAEQYLQTLSDERQPEVPGSRFIYMLEMLRCETERLETAEYFPDTTRLIEEWQTAFDNEVVEEFRPKIIHLCQSIESDLQKLFSEFRSIYTVPYRIGVIGRTSVGKSALIMKLANLTNYSSMVNLDRSTFGYLQFDTAFRSPHAAGKTIPVCFVDIAGSTDDQTSRSIGNYVDLIMNADCDVYMMLFDKPFDQYNQSRLDFIEKTLGRQCVLVRSKVDLVFNGFYRQDTGAKFREMKDNDYYIAGTLQKTRDYCHKTDGEKRIEGRVFMTAAGEDNELSKFDFGEFELDDLKQHISILACRDMRTERVCRLATLASRTAVNTCFRRGYAVCRTKYQWLAAGASIVPFLDAIPAFLGEEQIRQAFGVHERSFLTNKVWGTKNSLEDYLTQHQVLVPDGLLKSGYFSYLVATTNTSKPEDKPEQPESSAVKAKILGPTFAAMGVLSQVFDDAIRLAAPTASGVLRTASIAGMVVGAVLTPLFAAWTFYSSGKRMNEHLHALCDDFQVILTFFILRISSQYRQAIQPFPSSSDDESSSASSSSDDD